MAPVLKPAEHLVGFHSVASSPALLASLQYQPRRIGEYRCLNVSICIRVSLEGTNENRNVRISRNHSRPTAARSVSPMALGYPDRVPSALI
jgi:hypothetical protein